MHRIRISLLLRFSLSHFVFILKYSYSRLSEDSIESTHSEESTPEVVEPNCSCVRSLTDAAISVSLAYSIIS